MYPDIWSITCYFNPSGYRTKKKNFERFLEGLGPRADNLLVVEMASQRGEFELHGLPHLLRVRGGDVMWQKERMLNLAIAQLPASCTKVAWLDCDLLFEDPDWLDRTSDALQRFAVVQPFDSCIRLGRGQQSHVPGREDQPVTESFAAAFVREPRLSKNAPYTHHGHTGFAWAARREVLDIGLYDACLTGGADHLMAHAFTGTLDSRCIGALIGHGSAYSEHFRAWAAQVRQRTQGNVGFVPGRVLHLWHGDPADRRHIDRNRQLQAFGFDPNRHLRLAPSGLWEWAEAPLSMQQWSADLFDSRKEDGSWWRHPRRLASWSRRAALRLKPVFTRR